LVALYYSAKRVQQIKEMSKEWRIRNRHLILFNIKFKANTSKWTLFIFVQYS
jgi:hypothetical protein